MTLVIIRNPDSAALAYLDLARNDAKVVLMQNAVYNEALRQHALCLEEDLAARGISGAKGIGYGALVDEIFAADKVICI